MLRGHTSAALCVTSLNGKRVAAGGLDGSIIIWKSDEPQKQERSWKAHEGGVRALCALKDGALVTPRPTPSHTPVCSISSAFLCPSPTTPPPPPPTFSAGRLVSAGDDGLVMVWDLKGSTSGAPKCAQELRDHAGKAVFGLAAVGKGGAMIASASLDKTVRLWQPAGSADSGEGGFTCAHVLKGHQVRDGWSALPAPSRKGSPEGQPIRGIGGRNRRLRPSGER